jgi:TetR/AcrR family transcriptional regulator, mexJK operon transcriptional repressor
MSATVVDEDPRVSRSRAAIRDAATACFLEHGYDGTSLEEVAERAGVAKRTIYNVFGDKETLFRGALRESLAHAERFAREVVDRLGECDDPVEDLRRLGRLHAQAVLGGRIVTLRRLLIREASRFPELARDYYDHAPRLVMSAIARALERYDARGQLRVPDPERAAEQFAFLVLGASLDEALFDAEGRPASAAVVEERARSGVEVFLRAHAAGTPVRPGGEWCEEHQDVGPPAARSERQLRDAPPEGASSLQTGHGAHPLGAH